jgi:hypothetical protein
MTESQQPDPEPPRPPGSPHLDLDIPIDPGDGARTPGNEDVEPEAGTIEPPD